MTPTDGDRSYALERLVDAVIVRLARHGRYPARATIRDLLERLNVGSTMPVIVSSELAARLVEVGYLIREACVK